MPKVTMNLTERDAENTAAIREATQARSHAQAVSIALSLTNFIIGELARGDKLLLQKPDGALERIVMAELAGVRPRAADERSQAA